MKRPPARIITRKQASLFLQSEAFNRYELEVLAGYSLFWSSLTRRQARQLQLDQIDFDLGLVWVSKGPIPLQPETIAFLQDRWLPQRRQYGHHNLLLTRPSGKPQGIQQRNWTNVTRRFFGCRIRDRDMRASLFCNLMKENPGLQVRELARAYYYKPDSYWMYRVRREYLPLLGIPPCSQDR